MQIRTRSIEYQAVRLKQHVTLADGKGKPGDLLLITSEGDLSLCTEKEFKDGGRFELVDLGAAAAPGKRHAGRPKGKPTAAPKPRANAPTLKADQMAEAKRLIEGGMQIAAAARDLGLAYGTVYTWAKLNGWRRPE